MIEWGNNWARAINYRRNNEEAFAGFFSQIGRLYNVHHIWCEYNLRMNSILFSPFRSTFKICWQPVTVQLKFFIIFSLGYKNLETRKETRESAWRSPGWDECVAYTVPLIREMHCRILNPTSFSPTK